MFETHVQDYQNSDSSWTLIAEWFVPELADKPRCLLWHVGKRIAASQNSLPKFPPQVLKQ